MTAAPTPQSAAETNAAAAQRAGDDVIVKCAGLTKLFRDFWLRNRVRAVDGLDLEVHRGEVFGLLGPNGSGKSTTIKMILGLLHPTAGRVVVFGKRPDNVATKKLIGYLPEESYLYPFLNARETLEYYGRLFHQSRPQRRKRIDMLLEMVGLDAVQRRPVGEYSKGMQRRIGLAQALINDPQLLILDEPTTGMDPIGTRQIKDLILRLKHVGKTIVLCSHLLADVEDVCDRVAIMYGGKLVEQGTLDALLTQQDQTIIQASHLDDQTIQQIDDVLRQHGKAIEKVAHPRQTLEKRFLDLVKREQARGTTTSGATSGGRIAEFLVTEVREGHMPQDAEASALIEQLIAPTAGGAAEAETEAQTESEAAAQTETTAQQQAEADEAAVAKAMQPPADESVIESLRPPEPEPEPPAVTVTDETVTEPEAPGGETAAEADLTVIEGLITRPQSQAPPADEEEAAITAPPAVEEPAPVDDDAMDADDESVVHDESDDDEQAVATTEPDTANASDTDEDTPAVAIDAQPDAASLDEDLESQPLTDDDETAIADLSQRWAGGVDAAEGDANREPEAEAEVPQGDSDDTPVEADDTGEPASAFLAAMQEVEQTGSTDGPVEEPAVQTGERPDQSFIEALSKVRPPSEGASDNSGDQGANKPPATPPDDDG